MTARDGIWVDVRMTVWVRMWFDMRVVVMSEKQG